MALIVNQKSQKIHIDMSYYEHFRNDAVADIPERAKSILSVGCAAGKTEAELVKRGMKVVGVEINPKAAEIARQRGLIVLEGMHLRLTLIPNMNRTIISSMRISWSTSLTLLVCLSGMSKA